MATGAESKRARRNPVPESFLKTQRVRLRLVMWVFILAYAVIAVRLVQLQVDPSLKLSKEDLRHIGEVEIQRPRGKIFDRNGRVLALDRTAASLSANPSKVSDPDRLARLLSKRLAIDEAVLRQRFNQRDAKGNKMKFVWVKRWLEPAELESLGAFSDLPDGAALSIQKESLRYYPDKALAAHVLGFSNRDGTGGEGLELAFDKYLSSVPGRRVSRVDSKRNVLGYLTLEFQPPTGGDDLHLTLDAPLQFTLERELAKAMLENKSPRAMGILMDAHTGAIYALASIPAFDPNRYWDYTPEDRKNRALVDVFEPGSAFKIVTASAAIEHGLIKPDDKIDCENGVFNPYGHTIRDTHKLGVVPFWKTFVESSNIATIKVAALLGDERLESWITRYGFGQRTGIELPGESRGIFRPLRKWSRLSMGSLPMGQEISVTVLQLAQAFAVIANGGNFVRPYIVDRAVSKGGEVTYRHEAAPSRRIVSETTAETMRLLLHQVVADPKGTGRYARIQEYRAAGKTGTAQVALPNGGGYSRTKYTTVFAGFAPVANPKVVCVIVVHEPMIKQHYGGYVCGPVFKEVVREALIRFNVPEDPMKPSDSAPLERFDALRRDPDTMVARLELDLFEPEEVNFGASFDSLELLSRQGDVSDGSPILPSLIGMTKREAKSALVELGLPWDPLGAGRVVRQDPPPGTRLDDVTVCQLEFSN